MNLNQASSAASSARPLPRGISVIASPRLRHPPVSPAQAGIQSQRRSSLDFGLRGNDKTGGVALEFFKGVATEFTEDTEKFIRDGPSDLLGDL